MAAEEPVIISTGKTRQQSADRYMSYCGKDGLSSFVGQYTAKNGLSYKYFYLVSSQNIKQFLKQEYFTYPTGRSFYLF